jgi:hypothetical protein
MLVHNEHLLFNIHGIDIKITVQTDKDREGSFAVIAFIGKHISVINSM